MFKEEYTMGITKVLSGAALGTILSISSLTSAHAAVIHKDSAAQAKVETKQEASVSIAKAKEAALKNCSCKGAVQSAQMKKINGAYVYVVNILDVKGMQHTVNVNCDSGKVVKHQIEKKQQFISKTGAEKIALKNCKGAVKSAELKSENNVMVYVVQVSGQDGKLHTIHINCKNSKIVKHDIKDNQQYMTRTKAESFALSHCKGAVKSAEMKKENGVSVYVVSIFGQDGKLHTLHMDGKSGKVLKEDVQKKQVMIASEKAHSIALSHCSGIVKSSEMKKENGVYMYIVKITAQNHTVQTVKVNAENGTICK
jgi:uncharacterized membrane protein YkoI